MVVAPFSLDKVNEQGIIHTVSGDRGAKWLRLRHILRKKTSRA